MGYENYSNCLKCHAPSRMIIRAGNTPSHCLLMNLKDKLERNKFDVLERIVQIFICLKVNMSSISHQGITPLKLL